MEESIEQLIARIGSTKDLYAVLGVKSDADASTLTKAYRKLALKLHPDKCTLSGSDDAFKKVSNAFTVLKDADQRAHYDRFGGDASSVGSTSQSGNPFGGAAFNPEDLFEAMFRDHPQFAHRRRGGEGGGMGGRVPGGVQFSFNTMPGGFAAAQPVQLPQLPAPLLAMFTLVSQVVPMPVLILLGGSLFLYLFAALSSLVFRNLFYVFILNMAPIPASIKTYVWYAFFCLGFLGYI
jgi:hypothetical protein